MTVPSQSLDLLRHINFDAIHAICRHKYKEEPCHLIQAIYV